MAIYRLTLQKEDVGQKREQLKQLIESAYRVKIARLRWRVDIP